MVLLAGRSCCSHVFFWVAWWWQYCNFWRLVYIEIVQGCCSNPPNCGPLIQSNLYITRPKFSSSRLKSYQAPKGVWLVFQPPIYRGELLNFGNFYHWSYKYSIYLWLVAPFRVCNATFINPGNPPKFPTIVTYSLTIWYEYLYIYIYNIPETQMGPLVLEGFSPKIEDEQVPDVAIHLQPRLALKATHDAFLLKESCVSVSMYLGSNVSQVVV